MKTRICAIGIIKNEKDEILICKMAHDRGVYMGQWGVLGGGMDPGEKIEETLKREAMEELSLTLKNIVPYTFHDDTRDKKFADGHVETIYMVYCIFDCEKDTGTVTINDEWEEFAWVKPSDLHNYDLNAPTRKTFTMKGWL